jgi:hypothetical protein
MSCRHAVYTLHVYTVAKPKPTTEVSMREFRAAPAKFLTLAARTRSRLKIGHFSIVVAETDEPVAVQALHGRMRATGRVVGDPRELLSAHDRWTADE